MEVAGYGLLSPAAILLRKLAFMCILYRINARKLNNYAQKLTLQLLSFNRKLGE